MNERFTEFGLERFLNQIGGILDLESHATTTAVCLEFTREGLNDTTLELNGPGHEGKLNQHHYRLAVDQIESPRNEEAPMNEIVEELAIELGARLERDPQHAISMTHFHFSTHRLRAIAYRVHRPSGAR